MVVGAYALVYVATAVCAALFLESHRTAELVATALLTTGPLTYLVHLFVLHRRESCEAALELQLTYRGTVMLLADVVELQDEYTACHTRSVVELVETVASEMGVGPEARHELESAAMLHDVGKIAMPREILTKPAGLTPHEYELIKTHTLEGQLLLDRVGGFLGHVGEIVRSCHERWDGRGYPDGLRGDTIPLAARIVFVCDAYNAMTTDRVYRRALSRQQALAELTAHSGTQFDPAVVACFLNVLARRDPVAVTTREAWPGFSGRGYGAPMSLEPAGSGEPERPVMSGAAGPLPAL